jgi:hypothetical protein
MSDCVVVPGFGSGKVLPSGSGFTVTVYTDALCSAPAANFTSVPLNTCTVGPGYYIFLAPTLTISGTYLSSDCAYPRDIQCVLAAR